MKNNNVVFGDVFFDDFEEPDNNGEYNNGEYNSGEFANEKNFLQDLLKAAKELDTNLENLNIIMHNSFVSSSRFNSLQNSISKDCLIKTIGTGSLPYIQISRTNSRNEYHGYGIELYQCNKKPYKYIIYNKPTDIGTKYAFISKKTETHKIIMHFKDQSLEKRHVIKKPILDNNLMEDILKNSFYLFKERKKAKKLGGSVRRGLIFLGPPGNGKSMMCSYLISLLIDNNILYSQVDAAIIENHFSRGKKLEDLFECGGFIFLDDIDVSFMNRNRAGREDIASSLLSAISGISQKNDRIIIFTTNENIENMDDAFIRPGRIDSVFNFENPNNELRKKLILQWDSEITDYLKENDLVDLLIKKTNGYSFASLEGIKNILINNYLYSKKWDIKTAITEFENSINSKKDTNNRLGFLGEVKKKL